MPALNLLLKGVASLVRKENIPPIGVAFKKKPRRGSALSRALPGVTIVERARDQQQLDVYVGDISAPFIAPIEFTKFYLEHMLHLEKELMPKQDYIRTMQTHAKSEQSITEQHRADIIRNQIRCACALKMSSGALFMSIAYFDRFLSGCRFDQKDLSILSAGCLYIASKYEDTSHAQINLYELAKLFQVKRDYVLNVEVKLLATLEYRLSQPTPKTFIVMFLKAGMVENNQTFYFALFLAEVFQTDYACLKYMPSLVGKIVAWISICTFNMVARCERSHLLTELAALKDSGVAEICVKDVQRSIEDEKKNKSTTSEMLARFGSDKYLNVAHIDDIHFDTSFQLSCIGSGSGS